MNAKQDYIVGGILIIMGLVSTMLSLQIVVKTGSTDPGSRLFPLGASLLLMLCGIGVFLTAAKSEKKTFLNAEGWKRLGLSFAIMILYVLALKYIGFLISTPVFLFAVITLLASGQKVAIWKKLIYAAVVTGLAWYVFHGTLSMSLPKGVLF